MDSLFTFPFKQIALVLRTLSLSGSFGNAAAIVLYIVLCSSPVFYMLYRKKKQLIKKEDCLLAVFSISLFGGIYLFINPGYIRHISIASELYLTALGSTLWSVLICYVIFRILHNVERKESIDLLCALRILLVIIAILTICSILGSRLFSLVTELQQTVSGNTTDDIFQEVFEDNMPFSGNLNATCIWLIIKYILDNIPSLLLLWVIHLSMKLVHTLETDSFSEGAVILSQKLGLRCKNVVIAISVLILLENILQLLFSQFLLSSHYQIFIPTDSLLFVFIILLLSRKLSESRTLKLDNDSFI